MSDPQQPPDPLDGGVLVGVGRLGEQLAHVGRAIRIRCHHIGERAAAIYPEAPPGHGSSLPPLPLPGDGPCALTLGRVTASALVAALRRQGISDPVVPAAMSSVPRDEFVPPDQKPYAWENTALPIGAGQTISQPFVVAYTIQTLRLPPGSAVLDVGTGCGYQAAVLAECGYRVFGVEIRPQLADRAQATLSRLGYSDVNVALGDGRLGLPEHAPFDGVVVAAASRNIPEALVTQLRSPGGRLILPLGDRRQRLVLVETTDLQPRVTDLLGVVFVPLL